MTALPKSLEDNRRLDRWLGFAAGRVQVSVGKVEIGQGIATALAQIAAEELDVSLARLDWRAGDTQLAPDEGSTSSSLSIEVGGASLRLVCAEARALFLAEAARLLNASPDELDIADGAILRDGAETGHDYWSLAARVELARDATGAVPPKPRAAHRIVGTSTPRRDLPEKLAGRGFVHDMVLPGMRHARVLRQPRPGATLVSLDAAAIARAGASLVRSGDFAAVVAPTEAVLRSAAEAARPQWRDGDAAAPEMAEAAWLATQPADIRTRGSEASPPAGRRHAASYSRPYVSHASLGPSCAVAHEHDGILEIWSHVQGVYPFRANAAGTLGRDPDSIIVRHAHGPGCYGHNGADDAALDAAIIATLLPGTPIRVLWSRADEFAFAPAGTAMQTSLSAVLDADGRPIDLSATIVSGVHVNRGAGRLLAARTLPNAQPLPPPAESSDPYPGAGTRNIVPYYDIPATRYAHHLVAGTPIRTSALRGLGAVENVFALESFMDELAGLAGRDPVAYRLGLLSDPRARRLVERTAAMANWPARGPAGTGVGLGLAFARYKNRSGYACVAVRVEADTEIRLRHIWCAADAGLAINPDGVRAQLEGGIIQAASMTLKEQLRIDADGIASRSWADYPILRFSEIPPIDIALMDEPDEPSLGMGECTMGPTAAAIANAASHALGLRLRHMPLTRERILAAAA
ncbi:MAG: xanthine dehydrogenase family protein molybdopterin-binding subunit [Acetobacteraceae bacterium]|nr:xanthine dehydrogenase family protein molybdopterin-binding subunit [Acetobacteraceae bacterium]